MIMDQPLIIDVSLDEGIFNIAKLIIRFIPIQNLTIKDIISTTDQLYSFTLVFLEWTRYNTYE